MTAAKKRTTRKRFLLIDPVLKGPLEKCDTIEEKLALARQYEVWAKQIRSHVDAVRHFGAERSTAKGGAR